MQSDAVISQGGPKRSYNFIVKVQVWYGKQLPDSGNKNSYLSCASGKRCIYIVTTSNHYAIHLFGYS